MERKKRQTRKTKGRPCVITSDVLEKLIGAFQMGLSIREAAAFVGISKTAICDYLAKNPEFKDNVKTLQIKPSTLAKVTIYGALAAGDIEVSRWFLERQSKRESEKERARLMRVQRQEIERASNPESLPDAIVDLTGHWARVDAYFSSRKPESEKQEGETKAGD